MLSTTEVRPKPKPAKIAKIKKRRKTSERKLLERKLDALCREIVLDRDLRCVCPSPSKGHSEIMQPGHLISRTKESVRWSLLNVHVQCSSCNFLHEHFPHRYINWFLGKFGVLYYGSLCLDADKSIKLQVYELQELYDQMKKVRQIQLQKSLTGEPWKPYFTQADILSGAWSK